MVCRQLHEIDLEMYTRWLHNEIDIFESYKEATTLLELALWKAAIDRFPKNKKARIDKQHSYSYREQCRINCGAEIVLPNVLPFLWRSLDSPGAKRSFRYSSFIREEIW